MKFGIASPLLTIILASSQISAAQQSPHVSQIYKGDDSEMVPLTLEKEGPEDSPNGPIGTTRWFVTKHLASGNGSNFSKWYFITSPPPPAGYIVLKMTFTTRGDRHCSGGDSANYQKGRPPQLWQIQEADKILAQDYAECELVERTAKSVTWRFRFKGHHDADNKPVITNMGPGISVGHYDHSGINDALLSVTYIPAPK